MWRALLLGLMVIFSLGMAHTVFAAQLTPAIGSFAKANTTYGLSVRADGVTREVSLAQIESLKHFEITMQNAPGGLSGTFSGVLLVDLLKWLGLDNAKRLHLRAADDYKVTLQPKQEEGFDQVLFVTRLNGQTLSIANKGPFLLIWGAEADRVEAGSVSTVKWIWNIVEIRKVH